MKILLAFLCLLIPSIAIAQERPDVKVGDTWTFIQGYNKTGTVNENTEKVTAVSDAEIATVNEKGFTLIYDRDWKPVAQIDGDKRTANLSVQRPSLSFPLAIGRKWKGQSDYKNGIGEQLSYKPEAEVVDKSKITVTAGSFDTLVIKTKGWYTGSSGYRSFVVVLI